MHAYPQIGNGQQFLTRGCPNGYVEPHLASTAHALRNRSTNQPINQPTSQSTNQPTNQPTSQPANQPINQPTNTLTNQQTDHLISHQTKLTNKHKPRTHARTHTTTTSSSNNNPLTHLLVQEPNALFQTHGDMRSRSQVTAGVQRTSPRGCVRVFLVA